MREIIELRTRSREELSDGPRYRRSVACTILADAH
jgi:hypothetical protein